MKEHTKSKVDFGSCQEKRLAARHQVGSWYCTARWYGQSSPERVRRVRNETIVIAIEVCRLRFKVPALESE